MENQYVMYGKNQYLRMPMGEGMENAYELSMLHATLPKNLLPMQYVREKDGNFLDYCVTGLVSLEESQDDDEMETYFQSILFALERLGKTLDAYLLSEQHIVLEPSKIFLRKEMGEFLFMYSLTSEKTVRENLTELMEFFLKRLNPLGEREVLLTYGIYQKAREPHVTLKSLAEFYREKSQCAGDHQEFQVEFPKEFSEKVPFREEAKKLADPLFRQYGIERPKEKDGFSNWRSENQEASNSGELNLAFDFGESGETSDRYSSFEREYEANEHAINENEFNMGTGMFRKKEAHRNCASESSMEGADFTPVYESYDSEDSTKDTKSKTEKTIVLFVKQHLFELGVIGTVVAGMVVVLLT